MIGSIKEETLILKATKKYFDSRKELKKGHLFKICMSIRKRNIKKKDLKNSKKRKMLKV